MSDYYVYIWKDPETLEVFYVGKGKGPRAWKSHKGLRCYNKLKKLLDNGYTMEEIVNIHLDNLSESIALDIETQLISEYKRIEDGGTLFNYRTDNTKSGSYKKIIDQGTIECICNDYIDGDSAKSIGNKYGAHETTILRWLKEYDITVRNPGSRLTQLQKDRIIGDYMSGLSMSKVAKNWNITASTVHDILKQRNIPARKLSDYS